MTDNKTVNEECGICLEELTSAVTLPCNHKFCADCLDGWKSKFGSTNLNEYYNKKERSKSCPLCREKIPPSKDMLMQLEFYRKYKRKLEEKGDTTSQHYISQVECIKKLEAEIGDYEGEGLDYDDDACIELPNYIFDAVMKTDDMKSVMDWLGSPIDKNRLSARYPGHANATLVHLSVYAANSDLLSILLQYGADVNALDANGWNPFIVASQTRLEQAKILLEWGVEMILPPDVVHSIQDISEQSNKDEFIRMTRSGNSKMANLISSEFGGRRCEVINLPNHPQLNGKACVVEKYITKKDRYKIIFEGSGNAALVGLNNLKRRDRTPLNCGYYITFKNGRISRREFATKEECQEYVASLNGNVKETVKELESLKL